MPSTLRRPRSRGFTLVELLVVIAIIGLISAVALPVVLPALNERRVSEAARILQAVLSGTRDAAIRANAPRGIRLLPDPVFGFAAGQPLASNRFVSIEPAPDYNEGVVNGGTYSPAPAITSVSGATAIYLRVASAETVTISGATVLNAPTGWQFNIRQGDRIRLNDSGGYYTIAGPIHGLASVNNPERYICYRSLADETTLASFGDSASVINTKLPLEYLNLTNGIDDDGDGWIDEGCDGIDNDGDGIIDPGYNGIDDDGKNGIDDPAELFFGLDPNTLSFSRVAGTEYEQEVFTGVETTGSLSNANYTIIRRPVVSPGSAETTLPAGAVIDLTTWNAAAATPPPTAAQSYPPLLPERSRLPVDPFSGYVDILIDQTGRVVPPGAGSGGGGYYANSPIASLPFYHFWITEREGVVAPLWDPALVGSPYIPTLNPNFGITATSQNYFLPMPQGTPGYLPMPNGTQQPALQNYSASPIYLKGERRLVTLFTKTGQIVSNSIESFNANDTNQPYYDAQSGTKESQ